jgi:NitT/TauT family transport system substrate-binding protein
MFKVRKSRGLAAITIASVAVLALGACTGGDAPGEGEGSPDIITLRDAWIPDQSWLPFIAAKANGYYEEEGIVLVEQAGNGGATAIQLVANGQVMVGTGETAHLLAAEAQGIELVSVIQLYQEQPMAVVTLKSSGIDSWEKLKGKSIGGTATSSGTGAIFASLKLKGVEENEVNFVNLSPGAQFAALLEGDIDAAGTFVGNLAAYDFYDDLNILPVSDAGYYAPSTAFFMTREFVEKNEDLVQRFVRATLRGLVATLEDPAKVAEAMAGMVQGADAASLEATWLLDQQFIATRYTDENGLGLHNPEAWADQASSLLELGELDKEVDVSKIFTNEFVDAVPLDLRSFTSTK